MLYKFNKVTQPQCFAKQSSCVIAAKPIKLILYVVNNDDKQFSKITISS